jgi:sphinganine-1-phosphate aldolase
VIEFPRNSANQEDILNQLRAMKAGDGDWQNGRIFSLVFNPGSEVKEFAEKAFNVFINENGLSPLTFPSLKKMENEVVAMMISLLGGSKEAAGNMTTGGTESLMSVIGAAKDFAFERNPKLKQPELVIPASAHPCINKAAHYLGIKVVTVPTGNKSVIALDDLRHAINKNTIMVIASAPSYPHGIIDPIEEIAKIAAERDIWFHVDACVGGMILPFVRNSGYNIPKFDLSVPGVWSISADLHKYGYTPKGASVVLYRSDALRKYQIFAYPDWPGGIYATAAISGSRSGGPIAASWGVIKYLGLDGFTKLAGTAMKAVVKLQEGIKAIPGLYVIGAPLATVFAIGSDSLNVYTIGEKMKARRWYLDSQQRPPSLHMTVTPVHINVVEPFLKDLRAVAMEVSGLGKDQMGNEAALYEIVESISDRHEAEKLAVQYLSDIYKTEN